MCVITKLTNIIMCHLVMSIVMALWVEPDAPLGELIIGDYVFMSAGVQIQASQSITIEKNALISENVYISDCDWHDLYQRNKIGQAQPVHIKENVWLCRDVTICKGVTIGKNCIIGTGAVVTSDIPDNSIAVGVPAKVIKTLDDTQLFSTREMLFNHSTPYLKYIDDHKNNSYLNWLRTCLFPNRLD